MKDDITTEELKAWGASAIQSMADELVVIDYIMVGGRFTRTTTYRLSQAGYSALATGKGAAKIFIRVTPRNGAIAELSEMFDADRAAASDAVVVDWGRVQNDFITMCDRGNWYSHITRPSRLLTTWGSYETPRRIDHTAVTAPAGLDWRKSLMERPK